MLAPTFDRLLEEFTKTESNSFRCSYCQKFFKKKFSVKRHINVVHLQIKDYFCECGLSFATKEELDRHTISKHTELKPYICQQGCTKAFSSTNARSYHHKIYHEKVRFKCLIPECKAEFTSLKHLRNHMHKPHNDYTIRLAQELSKKDNKISLLMQEIEHMRILISEKFYGSEKITLEPENEQGVDVYEFLVANEVLDEVFVLERDRKNLRLKECGATNSGFRVKNGEY